ncbi:MAG TPA: hypothetical protein VJ761_19065 [Ktedonobacteraceae bacterium]|nr:hypothetical protein [Ktedonobacteraceae bacterium]
MVKVISKGICNFCKSEIDKSKMSQHLKYCKQRKQAEAAGEAKAATSQDAQKTKLFHVVVEGRYNPQYWMHLELPALDTFEDLDQFLRDTWVECCGHLSEFRVGNKSYTSEPEDFMWGMPDVEEDDEEDYEDEEEEEALFDPEIEEELANMSPTEAAGRLMEVLTQEFQVNPLELRPEEFDAKLKALLTARIERETGTTLTVEQQAQIDGLVPVIRSSLQLTTNPFFESMLNSMDQESDMDVEMGKALKVGQKFSYEYDFGSTTDLVLRVVSEREGFIEDEEDDNIEILARNNAPEMPCVVCGKPAKKVAPGYDFNVEAHAYCSAKCARKNEEEFSFSEMLPVVNSPRVGVCGYTG